jgi:Holliday junction resolvase RusA-like endonuclease
MAEIARKAMGGRQPFTGALSVSIRIRLDVPASMSKKQRARILAGEEPYLGRIDCDNAAKAALDAMNAVVFGDDKQITRLWVTKEPSANPGIDVKVMCLEPQP